MKVSDNVPRTPEIKELENLLRDRDDGERDPGMLTDILEMCHETMNAVTEIAKEVGGDPAKSDRYVYALELSNMIYRLRSLLSGTYTFSLPGKTGPK